MQIHNNLSFAMDDKLIAALLGVAAVILGAVLNQVFRHFSWRQETLHALERARYDESVAFLDSVSTLCGKRFFHLQRLVWALEEAPRDDRKIKAIEKEYFGVVKEWNIAYWAIRSRIRLLLGDDVARQFLEYSGNGQRTPNPTSLHYRFRNAHASVQAARLSGAPISPQIADEMTTLNRACAGFIDLIVGSFLERAGRLELLERAAPGRRKPKWGLL